MASVKITIVNGTEIQETFYAHLDFLPRENEVMIWEHTKYKVYSVAHAIHKGVQGITVLSSIILV